MRYINKIHVYVDILYKYKTYNIGQHIDSKTVMAICKKESKERVGMPEKN